MGRSVYNPGDKIGNWTIIGMGPRRSHYLCECICGTRKEIFTGNLRNGLTRQCGCQTRQIISEKNTKHGMSDTRMYHIWSNMIARCCDPGNPRYYDYGGRGITICKEWRDDFRAFYLDMSLTYKDDLTIERINNDAGYSPENCIWIPLSKQNWNKR